MKEWSAVYNTKSMNGVEYSFNAQNVEEANEFCSYKFSAKNILLIDHEAQETFSIGDENVCESIKQAYLAKHGTLK